MIINAELYWLTPKTFPLQRRETSNKWKQKYFSDRICFWLQLVYILSKFSYKAHYESKLLFIKITKYFHMQSCRANVLCGNRSIWLLYCLLFFVCIFYFPKDLSIFFFLPVSSIVVPLLVALSRGEADKLTLHERTFY